MSNKNENLNLKERQPVVVVMGHVDHGKSSLLDAIRNTNTIDKEAGGITQHIHTYEISHQTKNHKSEKKITFIDTPGHAAFAISRQSGAKIADIAILIVSAEDGVKEQTKEAFEIISQNKIPFIVAISKVDKPNADIFKTKNSLIENAIYIEGMGGDISCLEIDSKTKKGLDELLETILLLAELQEFKYDEKSPATGFVLETILDNKRGITSTLVIKDGILPKSGSVLSHTSLSPIRIIEDWSGKNIKEAKAGQVIKVTGFDNPPKINSEFISSSDKKYLENLQKINQNQDTKIILDPKKFRNAKVVIPIIFKADTFSTLKSIEEQIQSLEKKENNQNGVLIKIISSDIGNITENDIVGNSYDKNVLIFGFNVKIENKAREEAERLHIDMPQTFDIIYNLTDWLKNKIEERSPFEELENVIGKFKVLKTFSVEKDKKVLGGKVLEGKIKVHNKVKIYRRDFELGTGKILELQSMKIKTDEILEGTECGLMVESKLEIIPGDIFQVVEIIRKKI